RDERQVRNLGSHRVKPLVYLPTNRRKRLRGQRWHDSVGAPIRPWALHETVIGEENIRRSRQVVHAGLVKQRIGLTVRASAAPGAGDHKLLPPVDDLLPGRGRSVGTGDVDREYS